MTYNQLPYAYMLRKSAFITNRAIAIHLMKYFSLIAVKVLKIVFELGCRNCSIINPFQLFTLQKPKREALVVCYLGMICSVCAAQAYFYEHISQPISACCARHSVGPY